MRVTNLKKSVIVCMLVMASFLLLTESALGAEQEFKKLELMKAYESEKELRAAHPNIFPSQIIRDEGNRIVFSHPSTRQVIKQFSKRAPEVLREEPALNDSAVWKRYYNYDIFANGSLLLYTEWDRGQLKSSGADPAELRGGPNTRILYNAHGEEIVKLPLDVNTIERSPDGQMFLGTGYYEENSPFVYLYSIDGTLLHTFEFKGGANASFSENGDFLIISSYPSVYIFSTDGTKIGEMAYKHLNQGSVIYGMFVSDDGSSLLVYTSPNTIRLFSIDGDILWEASSSRIIHCFFNMEGKFIQLFTVCSPQRSGCWLFEVRDLESGQLIDKKEVGPQSYFNNGTTILEEGGTFYEYNAIR